MKYSIIRLGLLCDMINPPFTEFVYRRFAYESYEELDARIKEIYPRCQHWSLHLDLSGDCEQELLF